MQVRTILLLTPSSDVLESGARQKLREQFLNFSSKISHGDDTVVQDVNYIELVNEESFDEIYRDGSEIAALFDQGNKTLQAVAQRPEGLKLGKLYHYYADLQVGGARNKEVLRILTFGAKPPDISIYS